MTKKITSDLINLMEKKYQRGQAILIILLVMVVGLTIGLSLATRSITDIRISTQVNESSQAFSAAEAGIEATLTNIGVGGSGCVGSGCYTVSVSLAGGNASPLTVGEVDIADTYTLWLITHDNLGNLQLPGVGIPYTGPTINVCWKKVSTNPSDPEPAMELTLLYENTSGKYAIYRDAFDPSGRSNNFTGTVGLNCNLSGAGFTYGTTITVYRALVRTPIALRLRPFYANSNIAVDPGSNVLPTQGQMISSIGTSGTTTRKVSVIQSYSSLPAIFDYTLFSGQSVTQP